MKRVWGFQMAPVVHEFFDNTSGKVVNGRKSQEVALKEASDRATERTGIVHNYVPVSPQDMNSLRVTDEGLSSTYNEGVKSGRIEKGSPAPWHV
jgi:hypothetical protein